MASYAKDGQWVPTPKISPDAPHVVYPEGPLCSEYCPGSWSEYHDGYSDGYERAERSLDEDRVGMAVEHAFRGWLVRGHPFQQQVHELVRLLREGVIRE